MRKLLENEAKEVSGGLGAVAAPNAVLSAAAKIAKEAQSEQKKDTKQEN